MGDVADSFLHFLVPFPSGSFLARKVSVFLSFLRGLPPNDDISPAGFFSLYFQLDPSPSNTAGLLLLNVSLGRRRVPSPLYIVTPNPPLSSMELHVFFVGSLYRIGSLMLPLR